MPARPVDVSVLVPVLNESAIIPDVVAAMRAQRFEGEIEFLLIDGGSSDGTRELLDVVARRDSRFLVLENPARRVPQALNLGLRLARGEFVARMDAHSLYPDDYVSEGVARLRRGDADWVSGPQVPYGVGKWSRRVQLALESRLGVGGAAFRRADRDQESDTGFTGMWRRVTLVSHGGWDEDWPVNQDGELAARMRAAGQRILVTPRMRALYVPRDSLRELARQYFRYGQYRAKTVGRHPHSVRRSHLLPPGLVVSTVAALAGRGPAKRGARAALALYGLAVVGGSATRARHARGLDAIVLPAVFATMHYCWGIGFWVGCARFGFPSAALARATGLSRAWGVPWRR